MFFLIQYTLQFAIDVNNSIAVIRGTVSIKEI